MQALVTRVNLIRHGECDDVAFLRGRTDSSLSKQGWVQMQQAIASLAVPDMVLSSPAQRCYAFGVQHFESTQAWQILQERNFGDWDGLSFDQLQSRHPKAIKAYLADPFSYRIPNAETLIAFRHRVKQLWQEVIQVASSQQVQQMHIFTHGGVMRLLIQQLLGMDDQNLFQIKIDYAARLSVDIYHSEDKAFSQFVELRQFKSSTPS